MAFAKVLIVDDSLVLRRLAVMTLHGLGGYEVDEARDPFEAFDLLEAGAYDLIITDLYMPGMDGLEFSRRVRESAAHAQTPLILVTGDRERFVEREARLAGIDETLIKPMDPRALEGAIERCLSTRGQATPGRDPLSAARLIDAFPFPAMVVDEHGAVLMGNAVFWDTVGRGLDDVGIACSDLGLPCHDTKSCPVRQSARTSAPASVRVTVRTNPVRVTAYPLAAAGDPGQRLFLHLAQPE